MLRLPHQKLFMAKTQIEEKKSIFDSLVYCVRQMEGSITSIIHPYDCHRFDSAIPEQITYFTYHMVDANLYATRYGQDLMTV